VKKHYIFPIVVALFVLFQTVGIVMRHSSLESIVSIVTASGIGLFATIGVLHVMYPFFIMLVQNVIDAIDLITFTLPQKRVNKGKKRILYS